MTTPQKWWEKPPFTQDQSHIEHENGCCGDCEEHDIPLIIQEAKRQERERVVDILGQDYYDGKELDLSKLTPPEKE